MAVPEWVETTIEAQAMVIQHWKNVVDQLNVHVATLTKEVAELKGSRGNGQPEAPASADGGEYDTVAAFNDRRAQH